METPNPTKQELYDIAFENMYNLLLEQELSAKEFNEKYDEWIKINAPKFGINL